MLLGIALMLDAIDPITPVDDAVRSLLNLGVGGAIALVFYLQWQREMRERKVSESRERALLREIAKLPPETTPADP